MRPDCYGVINDVHDATLWPFGAGACKCRKGAALIMQSGMITADMVMNQRSVPLAYVISAGNQAMLAVEDYEEKGLTLPQPSESSCRKLAGLLPDIATMLIASGGILVELYTVVNGPIT